MVRLIVRRVLRLIPVLLVVYSITFGLFKLTPGSPFQLGTRPLPPDTIRAVEKQYGLDKPWYEQYVSYLGKAIHGDFGPSYTKRGQSVRDVIGPAIPITLELSIAAFLIGPTIGIALGLLGAVRRNTWLDYLSSGVATLGVSIPGYVAVSALIVIFGVTLRWLPVQGWHGLFSVSAIIPVLALALEPLAVFARFTRSSALEVLGSDFIRTSRARGLRERTVVLRHVMKNALIPVLTVGGLEFAGLIGGSFFIETIANIPGLGRATVVALIGRDFPVIMATVLIAALAIVLVNLVVDVVYLVVDPRVEVSA
jgi:ABC-type dipeptide/oligopeptide/nickel transport system permease component